jgi:hypothetical protein
VKRQYLGRVGKVANGISTVHLSYVREGTGHALIGAREWIPTAHIGDPAASAVMGLPEELAFRTKGQLAIDILAEAVADGVRLDFVCGDEVSRSPSRNRTPARSPAPTRQRRTLARLAAPPPSLFTVVPPANTTGPPRRDRPGQVANGCCRTSDPWSVATKDR